MKTKVKAQPTTMTDILSMIEDIGSGHFTKRLPCTSHDPALNLLINKLNDTAESLELHKKANADETQKLIDGAPAEISHWDINLKNLAANTMYAKRLGKTPSDILGKRYEDVASHRFSIAKPFIEKALTGEVATLQAEVTEPDGSHKFMQVTFHPDVIDGNVMGFFTVATDVTALKETEKKSAILGQQLKNAQEIAKIGSWEFNLQNNSLFWSSEHYNIFEIREPQPEEQLYKEYRARIHPEDVATLDRLVERAKNSGEDFIFNHRLIFDNGKRIKHVQGIGRVKKDSAGKPTLISGTCQDLTDLIGIQEENRSILDALQIGVWKFNPIDQSLFWDKSMYRVFDVKEDEFSGHYQAWESTLTPEAKIKAVEELGQALRGEKEFDTVFEIQTKKKGKRYISGRAKVLRDQSGNPLMMYGVNIDITDQKTNEIERDRLSSFLEVVLQNVPSMIFVKDYKKNLSFSMLNKAGQTLLGVKEEQVLGKSDYDFFPKEQADFFADKDKQVFKNKSILKIEKEEINTPNGKRVLQTYKVPTFDENGEPHLLIGISNDVTDEIKMKTDLEIERTKSVKNAKLASLGEMSAGIAHEINNPLAIISGSIDLLARVAHNPEKLALKITTIKKSCDRISKIVTGLRKFSRSGDKTHFSFHSLCDITKEVAILTENKSKRHNVPVTIDCQTDEIIHCDEVEIEQVLVNLINNAIDAIKTKPERWIQVRIFEEGASIVLTVTDSGPGIPEAVRNRLFEPFFTTKKVGEGTGLGLSITKGILDEHKATISLIDDTTHTCFELRFPKVENSKKAA